MMPQDQRIDDLRSIRFQSFNREPRQMTLLFFSHQYRKTLCLVLLALIPVIAPAPPAATADTPQEPSAHVTPLSLTIDQAILLALENNSALQIERMNPEIRQTYADQARAAFDPVITGQTVHSRTKSPSGDIPYAPDTTTGALALELGLSRQLPTGTQVTVSLEAKRAWSDRYSDRYSTRAGVSVIQALLKGRPMAVNLATVRQADLQTRITRYELRGFAEALLAEVEKKYWEYTLARHQVAIFEESLALADTQLRQTRELIRVGRLAETEEVAGQAEMALRRQELIQVRSTMEILRLQLLRLLNPPGPGLWDRKIDLLTDPRQPAIEMEDVKAHTTLALTKRADLNQARLLAEKESLEVVKTKNGLLPRMDLFITLGKTGYADAFGGSVEHIFDEGYDVLAGLSFSYPLRNRNAGALHRRARLTADQAETAVENMSQLVELDVHSAYIQMERTQEQIAASKATRLLQEEKLRIETEKFRVGRSTNFMVAQAQRDLVGSRIAEIQAVADYLISLTRLHRLEGSLLERRGIRLMAP